MYKDIIMIIHDSGMGSQRIYMDNFHFVKVKPSIEHKDVSLIKEAIFKRAREKAEQMNDEKSSQYTSDVKNDVMEIASADFRSTEFNPFNKFKESMGLNKPNATVETQSTEEVQKAQTEPTLNDKVQNTASTSNNTFEIKPLKHNIERVNNSNFTEAVKDETMTAARNQFRQARNLITSLNFLNAQAAIQMAKYAHSKINYLS